MERFLSLFFVVCFSLSTKADEGNGFVEGIFQYAIEVDEVPEILRWPCQA